jgi:hypothetical protein
LIGNIVAGLTGRVVSLPPVSGYKLWLDGKDSTVFSFSSGAVVSEWRDKSGNSYNFSQGTVANQPTRGTDGLVDFDGSNDTLTAATKFMDNLHNGGSNTLFFIVRLDADVDSGILGTNESGSSGIGANFIRLADFDRFYATVNHGVGGQNTVANVTGNDTFEIDTTYLVTNRLDANDATAANRSYVYFGTGAAIQNNTQTFSPSTSTSTNNPALSPVSGFARLNGKIGEVLWYDSDLSQANRESVRDWLISKWGI